MKKFSLVFGVALIFSLATSSKIACSQSEPKEGGHYTCMGPYRLCKLCSSSHVYSTIAGFEIRWTKYHTNGAQSSVS